MISDAKNLLQEMLSALVRIRQARGSTWCCILVYDESCPYVRKVLRDRDLIDKHRCNIGRRSYGVRNSRHQVERGI